MIRKELKGVAWLEFHLLQPYQEICHGIFLKKNLPCDPLDEVKREQARSSILEAMGLRSLAYAHQVHGNAVKDVKELAQDDQCDGIYTAEREVGLVIKHADCQAAIFYDPIKHVIANVHSGWKGSVANIYGKMIQKLSERFGSNPSDMIVCISPSLGPDHAEFVHFERELIPSFYPYQTGPFHFDFWAISKEQLMRSGVVEGHIEIAGICTHCDDEDFFSYRRDKTSGRNLTVVGRK